LWEVAEVRYGPAVLCSDGLERGEPELLRAQMERLHRLAHKVVWVNPLKGSPRYEPLARGMDAAMPWVDVFLPGHNLESLEELGRGAVGCWIRSPRVEVPCGGRERGEECVRQFGFELHSEPTDELVDDLGNGRGCTILSRNEVQLAVAAMSAADADSKDRFLVEKLRHGGNALRRCLRRWDTDCDNKVIADRTVAELDVLAANPPPRWRKDDV
jgi:hypothetical protein